MTKQTSYIIIAAVVFVVAIVLLSSFYIVTEMKQVIITQFGEPIGEAVTSPGLHMKVPFIQKTNFFEKRWLEWDGDANEIPTK
ncbi:MAG: protease modulator HflC, partial [Candidatus Aminicenantes bacterium]|nr:protease modulator HflC [Candidatus Aminicenantes bacterium]